MVQIRSKRYLAETKPRTVASIIICNPYSHFYRQQIGGWGSARVDEIKGNKVTNRPSRLKIPSFAYSGTKGSKQYTVFLDPCNKFRQDIDQQIYNA
jgi:hypothetical protein